MALLDWLQKIISPSTPQAALTSGARVALTSSTPKPPPAGRVSLDKNSSYSFEGNWVMQPPPDYESYWRLHNLDVEHLDLVTPKELIDMLADLSPEVSYAIWQFQRLCNPGYECKVYYPGSEDREHRAGKKALDAFFGRLRDEYGSVDIILGRFFMGAYLRGAFCGELVLDAEGREALDLVAPDPYSIRFRKKLDPLRKEIWQPGQWQNGKFIPLDIPTFRYLPVDPAPASPYGRPLASPALFVAIFSLSLLHDVKRVVMQQGYKRIDISLDTEQAMDAYSYDAQGYETLGKYVEGAMQAVRDAYAQLEPDDAFIHTDIFDLKTPVGTVDADSISAIDTLMERLETKLTRALKSNGVVMDTGDNSNETDSNRKWEIHAAGIKSLQHHCENMLESLLTLKLRAQGIQARVQFRFAELRAAEMFRDEQTRALRIQNARNEYEAGFVSQDEAANNAVNHDADVPEPRKPLTALDFQQDNSSGVENLAQGEDERDAKILAIPIEYDKVEVQHNGNH